MVQYLFSILPKTTSTRVCLFCTYLLVLYPQIYIYIYRYDQPLQLTPVVSNHIIHTVQPKMPATLETIPAPKIPKNRLTHQNRSSTSQPLHNSPRPFPLTLIDLFSLLSSASHTAASAIEPIHALDIVLKPISDALTWADDIPILPVCAEGAKTSLSADDLHSAARHVGIYFTSW